MPVEKYELKLENFEGPFDLLFHLIDENEMDLYDIKISEITDQYMDYLLKMQQLDIEVASEFLILASTLLHIKSKMLLPKKVEDEEETDPRETLILQLIEYKKYKKASQDIKKMHIEGFKYYYGNRSFEDFGVIQKEYKLSQSILKEMYQNIQSRNARKDNHKLKYMNKILRHEKFTVGKKIKDVVRSLFKSDEINFNDQFKKGCKDKLDVIVAFLSILELSKEKKALVKQKRVFKDIYVRKTEKLNQDEYEEFIDIYK